MRLISDWKTVLQRAWSIRLLFVAGLLSGVEMTLPYLDFLPIPMGVFASLSFATTVSAFWARLVAQNNMPRPHE